MKTTLRASLHLQAALLSIFAAASANAFGAEPRAIGVNYSLPVEAEVSLGVFDGRGGLVRWLVQNEHRAPGENSEPWDGLDQYGNPAPAGSYQIKALYHPPVGLEYAATIGNPGQPPWPTPDDTGDWLSDEAAPQGVATDGKWVFLAAPGSEKGHSTIAVDETGQRRWGVHKEIYSRCVSLAVSGDFLYALYSGPELTDGSRRYNGKNAVERAILICLDKRTGQPARFSRATPNTRIAAWPYREDVHPLWDLRANGAFTPEAYGGQPRYFADDVGESTSALGIAATASRVYVSLFYENKILVLDAETAQPIDEIRLPSPVGLHAQPDGDLLAVSGSGVVKIDPRTKEAAQLVSEKLLAPYGVTSAANGEILVSDWAASFQVKVFDRSGRFLRAIGKEGGRPWVGRWESGGMLVPRGLAVTDAGRLWVAEDDMNPPRVSVWDSKSGGLIRDYLGPASYGGGPPFWLDPNDPTEGFTLGVLFHLDLAAKTWTPVSQPIRRMSRNQPFASYLNSAVSSAPHRFFTHDGKDYVAINGLHMVIVLRRDGERFTPVAAMGGLSRLSVGDGAGKQVWDSDIGNHLYRDWYPDFFKGHAGDNFVWTDMNGDGLVQPEEMRWTPTINRFAPYYEGREPEWQTPWGAAIAPDWSVFWTGFNKDKQATYRADLQGWTPGGAPIYDLNESKSISLNNEAGCINGLYANDENKLFVSYGYEGREAKPKDSFACFDRDGRRLWGVARPNLCAENVVGEFEFPGIGHVVGSWLWHGAYRPYLLTTDGLYVCTMLDDTRIGPTATWDESFKFYYQAPGAGAAYLVNGGNDSYHLLKLTGLENAVRLTAPLVLSEEAAASAAAARAAAVAKPKPLPKPILKVEWLKSPPKIDGELGEWNMSAGTVLQRTGNRRARIALGRDAKNLYLACAVEGASFVNKGTDWRTLFISGDAVDLMLSTTAHGADHYQPAAGDERVLFSLYEGEPAAVRYRPVSAGAAAPAQLMAARIDEIVRLPKARVAVKQSEHSYILEAAISFTDLGIDPRSGEGLKGDVGVIFADDTGTSRAQRLYHYNANTAITADLTTEATLQPGEWGPIEFPLGSNLLVNGGFEAPFAASPNEGWNLTDAHGGATAHIASDASYSGTQELSMEQNEPVHFSEEAYRLPDYGNFIHSANGGKGGGFAAVKQTVPVQPGKAYALRLHFRSEGLSPEKKEPGPGRGYAAFGVWVYWTVLPGFKGAAIWVANEQTDPDGWKTLLNTQTNVWTVTKPYLAPAGATAATVSLHLTTNVAEKLPKAWVDDVEFVEAADGPANP